MSCTIVFIGDVFGAPGRRCLKAMLPRLRQEFSADLVVANAENASGGLGLRAVEARELLEAGVDVLTTGNHVWRHKDLLELLETDPRVLRPANYPPGTPGRGWCVVEAAGVKVGVVNLEGRVFMKPLACPFATADEILAGPLEGVKVVLVDFHAEATSEKQALGWYLDGRVSAVVGTHTHVPTADERILPRGTAFQSDVGMCGPVDSVIGMRPEYIITRFLSQRPGQLQVAKGPSRLDAVVLSIDPHTGLATGIERISRML